MDDERIELTHRLYTARGELDAMLDLFGDTLAKKQGLGSLSGMEAIHYYLVRKFGWLPKEVRAMTGEDIRFVLTEEMQGWTDTRMTKARQKVRKASPSRRS
jgi:hypothetical protein